MGQATSTGWIRVLFYLLQFTWGLSVNLAGLLVFLCCRRRVRCEQFRNGIVTYLPGNRGGLSLGIFIFLSVDPESDTRGLCAHEYGHTVQCLFLGPLYWIVIAIPSLIWCYCFDSYRKRHGISYDTFYCECWATAWGNKWGGI